MAFFSVIIPTYNRANIIPKTILSVLNQKFKDWELLVIDDGGTDSTKKVIENFNDSRIKYFWKENGERGAARNYGVKQAQGQYVFFLDSDDIIYPEYLEHAFNELSRLSKPEFFHIRYEEIFPDKIVQIEPLNTETVWSKVKKQNKIGCQFFLRKDISETFSFSENRDLTIGEDWLLVLQIGLQYPLHISNRVLSGVMQHDKRSMVMATPEKIIVSRDLILNQISKTSKSISRNIFLELTSLAALGASFQKKRRQAIYLMILVILKSPFYIFTKKRTLAIIKHLLLG